MLLGVRAPRPRSHKNDGSLDELREVARARAVFDRTRQQGFHMSESVHSLITVEDMLANGGDTVSASCCARR